MKLAVVGCGVSGLVCAHLLSRAHEVTVFEASREAGGHANTVRIDTAAGTYSIDTGFIVFNERTYPNFTRLLAQLGVATQPSTMGFSVADEHGRFEYSSASVNGLFATRRHLVQPSFHRMVLDGVRFQRDARTLLPLATDGPALGEWLEQRGYSRAFVDRLIIPLGAAIWSTDPELMWSFPARHLAAFFHNHGMLGLRDRPRWRTIAGGSQQYVQALVRALPARIVLSAPVLAIERDPDGVTLTLSGSERQRFDEVVLATHADQALAMLADADRLERAVLGAIPYQLNEAVLHTDATLLPRRRRAWASWNYHLLDKPPGKPTMTYHMNRLQNIRADREFCVTLNRTAVIDEAKVLGSFSYAHPLYTRAASAAQRRHGEISGRRRTHFCGAYWGWGFHEDGVVSALRVAERMGVGGI